MALKIGFIKSLRIMKIFLIEIYHLIDRKNVKFCEYKLRCS